MLASLPRRVVRVTEKPTGGEFSGFGVLRESVEQGKRLKDILFEGSACVSDKDW